MTVVIPTYNRAQLLPASIESILGQTYTDFRLVVSDNVSTDETASVVARYNDPRLVYVCRQDHLGLNEHYNAFTAEIDTKYTFILPDDDLLLPEAIETLVRVLEKHRAAGIAHGRVRLVDTAGVTIVSSHDMTGLEHNGVETGVQFISKAMRSSHRVHGSTVLFRTEAIRPLALDMRDFPSTEFGLWLRMALDWDMAFVAKTLAVYRIHPSTYTSNNAMVGAGGYVQGPDTIQSIYKVKLRFLEEHAARLRGIRGFRREAQRALSAQLVNFAGHATLPERRLGVTIRTLADCVRREWSVLLEPGAWRLLGASMLGRRIAERIKRHHTRDEQVQRAASP